MLEMYEMMKSSMKPVNRKPPPKTKVDEIKAKYPEVQLPFKITKWEDPGDGEDKEQAEAELMNELKEVLKKVRAFDTKLGTEPTFFNDIVSNFVGCSI